MRYYSDVLKTVFDSERALVKAEKEYNDKKIAEQKKKEEKEKARAQKAKEVEAAAKAVAEAQKVVSDAQKVYFEKIKEFNADYGSFHFSIKNIEESPFYDLMKCLFY